MDPAQLAFYAVLLFGLYLLLIRPQRARARAMSEVKAALQPGARVMTTAGIHASVVEVAEDSVLLEVAPGVHVRFATPAVVRVLEPADAVPDEAAE